MRAAPRIDIAARLQARAKFLTRDYADVLETPSNMAKRLEKLRPYCSHARVDQWLTYLRGGKYELLAAELMEHHYDRGYERSRASRENTVLGTLATSSLDENAIRELAGKVKGLLDHVDT